MKKYWTARELYELIYRSERIIDYEHIFMPRDGRELMIAACATRSFLDSSTRFEGWVNHARWRVFALAQLHNSNSYWGIPF